MKRKQKTLLIMLLTMLCCIFSLVACNQSQGGGGNEPALKINAPTTRIQAELGTYDLPTYEVVNKDNLIHPAYSVYVTSVVDPDGENVTVAFNKIQATKTGVYKITYSSSEDIQSVTVEVDFADRLAPTLNIDVEKIPDIYCSGITYSVPTYTISDGPVLEKCYLKMYYVADGSTEREEIAVENSTFLPEYDTGKYIISIHVEDATGNAKDYEYKVNAFPGIKEEIPDKVTYFDEAFGTTQVSMYWPGPNKVEYDSETAYGEENGSLKVVAKGAQDWNYLVLKSPWIKDVSAYDYLEFYVYNPTEHAFMIEPGCSNLPMKCEAQEWSRIILPTSYFTEGKCGQVSGTKIKASNITNLPIRYHGFNFVAGEGFNISAIYGRNGEVPQAISDNAIIRLFEDRVSNITMSNNAKAEINTDATYNYGEENGSLKVTRTGTGEMYATLVFPETKNVSAYHELVFRAYNPTNKEIKVGMTWVGDTVCAPNAWTEVVIPVSQIQAGKLCDGTTGTSVSPTVLRNPTLRVISGLEKGESVYFSGVYARFEQIPEGCYFEETELKLFTDDTKQLVLKQGGVAVDNALVTWETTDANVATVSNGLVTAIGKGTATITATYDEMSVEVSVSVDADAVLFANDEGITGVDKFIADSNGAFISYRNDQYKWEGENGALKYVITKDGYDHYIRFRQPTTTDISRYKYVVFRVYNDSDCKVQISFMYGGYKILQPNSWTEICLDLSKYDNSTLYPEELWSTDNTSGLKWQPCRFTGSNWTDNTSENVFENITGSFIRVRKHESVANDADGQISLFFSKVFATVDETYTQESGTGTTPVVPTLPKEAKVAAFDQNANNLSVYNNVVTLAYDTTTKHGEEIGSLKITRSKAGEGYITLTAPETTDLTQYDYLVFYVYNPTDADVKFGICWWGDTVCKAGEWTEIKINIDEAWGAVAKDGSGQIDNIMTGADIPRSNITGLALRLISGLENGESIYVSAMYATMDTTTETA